MPISPTYPGVYIQEVPSGDRTITGVSTSTAAFIGGAKRGPVNKAVQIFRYADYEKRFGGLDEGSEMSFAVRQFFLNGGNEAWVVRIAKNPGAAFLNLKDNNNTNRLKLTALDEGEEGNKIEARVDYQTQNPGSSFNLTLTYRDTNSQSESFQGVSMNKESTRYVVSVIERESKLAKAELLGNIPANSFGTSTSEALSDAQLSTEKPKLVPNQTDRLYISVNGLEPVVVNLNIPASLNDNNLGSDEISRLCAQIQEEVKKAGATLKQKALEDFKCAVDGTKIIKMTSGVDGYNSSVRVLSGAKSAAVVLKLGVANGGTETDAVAAITPKESAHGTLTSGTPTLALPHAAPRALRLSLDGAPSLSVDLGGDNLANLGAVAARIQSVVNSLRPSAAFRRFTCVVNANKLVLTSGTAGAGSSVRVEAASANDVAGALGLLAGVSTPTLGQDDPLEGGSGGPLIPDDGASSYDLLLGDQLNRKGLYALDAVPLFNLLCVPGFTNPGILAEVAAYCKQRLAFLIVDPPRETIKPDEMLQVISGTDLPKVDHAAVYYPWIKIANPLKNGLLKTVAPCGTIAGLYARTDTNRGVWKAPAGTEANLVGVQALEHDLSDPENGTLNPLGVNCIRSFPVYGVVSWGARTLQGADEMADEYKYIPVRRTALFIMQSLYRGLKWATFEPNDEPLWRQLRNSVEAFMQRLFRQGAFKGQSPREAYFVRCGTNTTTPEDINLGIVNIEVGFAPLKPAEFVIVTLQQIAGQTQA